VAPGRCAEVLSATPSSGTRASCTRGDRAIGLPKGTCACELDLDAIPDRRGLPAPAVSPFPAVFQM
jgi:phenylalanyl-tRNA synthetase beta chain